MAISPQITSVVKSLLACLLFLACQIVAVFVVSLSFRLAGFEGQSICLCVASLLSSLLAICLVVKLGLVRRECVEKSSRLPFLQASGVILCAMMVVIGLNLLSELLELPDNNAAQMQTLLSHPLGILAVAIVAPVAEEIIFRESMIGTMLQSEVKPFWAIFISALAFGIIHANPIQIPFAFAMGILFGYIYFRRKNILLTSLLHIINNTIAVILLLCYGVDSSLGDLFSNTAVHIFVAIALVVTGVYWVRRLV